MRLALAVALSLAAPVIAAAQQRFTAEDMQKVATIAVLDVSDNGRRVAAGIRRPLDNPTTDHRRFGDPTYLNPARARLMIIDTQTGKSVEPFTDLVSVRQAAWSQDGIRLALLVADAAPVSGPGAGVPVTSVHVWNADTGALTRVALKGAGMVSANSELQWTPDGSRLIVTLRTAEQERAARARFVAVTEGTLVVHSSKDPFLEWDELRRADRQRTLAELTPETGETRLLVEGRTLSSYQLSRDGSLVVLQEDVTAKTDYDVIGGTTNAIHTQARPGGELRRVHDGKDLPARLQWSADGRTFAYSSKGEVFVQRVDEATPRSLTPKPADTSKDDKPARRGAELDPGPADKKEDFAAGILSADGLRILLTSKKGWYAASTRDGARQRILSFDEEHEEKNPRVEALDWSPQGDAVYATWSEPDAWSRGVVRIDATTGAMTTLVKDSRLYSNVRLSRDGTTFVFSLSDGDRPAELHVADLDFRSVRKLTTLNPWMADKPVPRSELVSYRDGDGKVLRGVLRYPIGYEPGRRYPTVFEIYETFFDNGFNARAAFLASHGYAVFHPSVHLVVGRPGESWVKGVTSAANKLIDMGVADPDRLGVHGTSYGGYATALLITETDRFKAAINISGKVNMVSFYTDSPRLGVRNTHAPEKSQDRIGGTLWEYPERYLEHSAILRADRIKTPLLNISGDQDPNVPASQSREMYYALRRLGKDVEWVRYTNGGHRPPNTLEESVDFEQRILGWYDKYLKKKDAKSTDASSSNW